MTLADLVRRWKLTVFLAFLAVPTVVLGAAIESGQYFSGDLYDWTVSGNGARRSMPYFFYATNSETVIVRVANDDQLHSEVPDAFIYAPPNGAGALVTNSVNRFTFNEIILPVTNSGWHLLSCVMPTNLTSGSWSYYTSNALFYTVSFLRLPNAPLSYADLDVGPLRSGEAKDGAINVGADLDAGTFAVTNRCTVQIRMGQGAVPLVPNIRLFDPFGHPVTNDFPPEYRAEFTMTLAQTGIYTVVCSDKFNGDGPYTLSMVQMPSTLATDLLGQNIGKIIAGETKTAKVVKPGQLNLAYFSAVTGDVVTLIMNEIDSSMNPVVELYDAQGNLLGKGVDMFQQTAVVSTTIASNGLYYVVCKDTEDRFDVSYTLTLTNNMTGSGVGSLPDVPNGLTASKGAYADHVEVRWNSAGGANAYDVWRSQLASTNPAVLATNNIATTVFEDYSVTTNVVYSYKVKSRNDYGVSTDFSNTDSGYAGAAVISANRRALVVGIDHYSPAYGPSDLTGCTNDANSIRTTMMMGDTSNRWISTNITLVTDRQATKSVIRTALNSLAAQSGSGDMVVYYHSSHGGQTSTSNSFICCYDDSYSAAELASDLAVFRPDTKIVIIIDTCYSGGMYRNAFGKVVPFLFVKNTMEAFNRIKTADYKKRGLAVPKSLGSNIGFMTASDYNELSWESDGHGLYTRNLILGCATTSVDVNRDGEYQFIELHNYAAAKTTEEQPTQHPQTYNTVLLESTVVRGVGSSIAAVSAGVDNDYDGDGKSDLAIYNEVSGQWILASLARGVIIGSGVFGGPGYKPVTGDYDGDRIADPAVYNESLGTWRIVSIARGRAVAWDVVWGGAGYTPVAGDYTSDRKSDLAVFQKSEGYWGVITLSGQLIVAGSTFTGPGYVATPGDFDGDHMTDFAMYNLVQGIWYIISPTGAIIGWGAPWGDNGYLPVPGDYDHDGKTDLAVYSEETGYWFILLSGKGYTTYLGAMFGGPGYTPVPGDYDGDGISDPTVYHEATGAWYILLSSHDFQAYYAVGFGGPGYKPVEPAW